MSTSPSAPSDDEPSQNNERTGGDEVDNMKTPRSEVPIAVGDGESGTSHDVQSIGDYFTLPQAPSSLQTNPQTFSVISPTAPHEYSPNAGAIVDRGPTVSPGSQYLSVPDRPILPVGTHSNLSEGSVDTDATLTALPRDSTKQRPEFPNQSFAALHSQQYPPAYVPRTLRQRTTHPGQILTFASALASTHQSGSRTVGNSPSVTPGVGLFTPPSPPGRQESPDSTRTYASPFLHALHRHEPKETHIADVDVDPISGRKLINHYEIIDELGRGTHGKVKLGRDCDTENTFVAIKIVERYSKRRKLGKLFQAEDKVKKEVAILKKARHPNIVALLEVIDDPSRKKVYIVLEWVEKGEILWRVKSQSKEIALIEARRYERERSGKDDEDAQAEDEAVLAEAQRRLAKTRRQEIRRIRQARREAKQDPRIFSTELIGEYDSEGSDDERLSRVSTATGDSVSSRVFPDEGRLPSRAPTPQQSPGEGFSSSLEPKSPFLPLTAEPQSSTRPNGPEPTGLEGTMYGAYTQSSGESSRVNSLHSLLNARASTPNQRATEILDSELNPELENVPAMTIQQTRVAFRDTLLGLQYLHYQGIVHRDIKPPNLLATSEHRVKISDFGVSYLGRPIYEGESGEDVSEHEALDLGDEARELAKTVGTPAFYAPELCIVDPGAEPLPVTKAIDVWALGVTLFCMLFARTPFVDSEFVVMRQIADEEIYIPRKRLVPVMLKPHSRPTSHSRGHSSHSTGRRAHTELVYEEIHDDLYDLLKRLLTKDPRKRITLEEVRHHPWLLVDITNKANWLEETDPSNQSQGKKIEVSPEDMNTAVVPLQFLDRVRDGIMKVGGKLFGGRARAGSTAGLSNPSSPAPSAGSSSTLSQDGRRSSLRGDESIFSALTRSRDGSEFSPAKHVVTSHEMEKGDRLSHSNLRSAISIEDLDNVLQPVFGRPFPPERSQTMMSTDGSVRTVKQTDYRKRQDSPPPSPGLPDTPIALELSGGHNLATIIGSGSARRVLKPFREKGSDHGTEQRDASTDRGSVGSADQHGEPSVALSQTMVAGSVNLPEALQHISTSSNMHGSPPQSSHPPFGKSAGSDLFKPTAAKGSAEHLPTSRKSSVSSIASAAGRIAAAQLEKLTTFPSWPQSRMAPESSVEDWQRADKERVRKLIREGNDRDDKFSLRDREKSCPPSPDDQRLIRRSPQQSKIDTVNQPPSQDVSPIQPNECASLPPALVSSSSDFGSAVSMSISNPSNPSVVSKASSVDPKDAVLITEYEETRNDSSDGTVYPPYKIEDDFADDGYHPDRDSALESDDADAYDSSSDSDGGLLMPRRKSISKRVPSITSHEGSLATALSQANNLPLHSKKSSRSGSNNTMKKIRTRDSEDERRHFDINED
ncbi:serine/threonine-protein kinase ssp1 [Acrodontium crateriforme]|uniref:non-specific serine/threonine protein kinase n=1 Tax=Acrodontium crateriforme TaxID=150365 RepID=A0AAQ3LYP9_9PEZI|nr:serine/threonine-protein kinase ssp1 [Acrodontium crateriforme]